MLDSVDIFVGNDTVVDISIYQLWLDGYSAQESVSVLMQRKGFRAQFPNISADIVLSDTLDHYRTYDMLEKILQTSDRLAEQLTCQIEPQTQKLIIEKYYEFNDDVVRDILGKKLSSRNRKDLDDVSEKTHVSLKSCRRQFDNIKRVFKHVEDQKGSLLCSIQSSFLLPEYLARKYAAIAFITNNRFETAKKKLSYLTLGDFLHCANAMILKWAAYTGGGKTDEGDSELDKEFLQDLKEVKILCEREIIDEHKALVCKTLKARTSLRFHDEMDINFKALSRAIINIACGLNHSREAKDIFVDLVEKVVDPCKSCRWTDKEVEVFLCAYKETAFKLEPFKNDDKLCSIWNRYIQTISLCLLRMYHQ